MSTLTPAQVTTLISKIGAEKAHQNPLKLLSSSFLGGSLLSFGSAISLLASAVFFPSSVSTPTNLTLKTIDQARLLSSMVFPIGLTIMVLTGANLFTSYCMYSTVAILNRGCTLWGALKTLLIDFVGNAAGVVCVMLLLIGYGGVFDANTYRDEALAFAAATCVSLTWYQIFLRGILYNWLLCIAVFLSLSVRDILPKIVAVWLPVVCFVGLGGDHVIANMYFIPLSIFLKAPPPLTIPYYLLKSMLPSLLGDVIGGSFFCGVIYYYIFLHDALPDLPLYALKPEVSNLTLTPEQQQQNEPRGETTSFNSLYANYGEARISTDISFVRANNHIFNMGGQLVQGIGMGPDLRLAHLESMRQSGIGQV